MRVNTDTYVVKQQSIGVSIMNLLPGTSNKYCYMEEVLKHAENEFIGKPTVNGKLILHLLYKYG